MALFVPFGVLLLVVCEHVGRPVLLVTASGALLSAVIEVLQFAFSLGRTDVSDLLFNTVGAALGALLARAIGPRWYPAWIGLALALGVVFAVLVGVGDRLGDPS